MKNMRRLTKAWRWLQAIWRRGKPWVWVENPDDVMYWINVRTVGPSGPPFWTIQRMPFAAQDLDRMVAMIELFINKRVANITLEFKPYNDPTLYTKIEVPPWAMLLLLWELKAHLPTWKPKHYFERRQPAPYR